MGALDFLKEFENRAIDAATYKLLERNFEMQEANNRLYREKAELLSEELALVKADNESLHAKLAELNETLSRNTRTANFKTYDGIAFHKRSDGKYEETPYCPNCHRVMGKLTRKSYQCSSCQYLTQVQLVPESAAQHLNAQSEGEP